MTKIIRILSLMVGGTLLIALIVIVLIQTNFASGAHEVVEPEVTFGSAPSGLYTTQITATTTAIGPDGDAGSAITIFAVNNNCTSRTISTTDGIGQEISFLTGDPTNGDISSTTLSNVNGNYQAGSSTITYDGGLNGCGRWTAYALATTTLVLIEYK